ncbi:hypothetical protein B9Z65_2947 [Elsinoe australis]|uniref:Calcineurin-like phosphoesterase domain-containing protein n=1 Tax=Elsinoe australis TaxID=40998 RepID=A0A2P7ZTZ7_9PEZI|nr:hypothetical protein B9Z65_2947 [Elsinoe australis]
MSSNSRHHRDRIHSDSDARHEPEASEPLISKVTNAWQSDDEKSSYFDDDDSQYPGLCDFETVSPRRAFRRSWHRTKWVRRIIIALVAVYLLVRHVYRSSILPWIEEDRLLRPGLDKVFAGYGNQAPHHVKGFTQLSNLSDEVIPGGSHDSHGNRRLVFVGDIHGRLPELDALLKAVNFNPASDHLVHTGDVIAKGPDSAGVIDRLIALNASGVRGNWEDRLLVSRTSFHPSKLKHINKPKYDPAQHTVVTGNALSPSQVPPHSSHPDPDLLPHSSKPELSTLRLKPHHITYLTSLPLILSIPALPSSRPLFSTSDLPNPHPLANLTTTSPHHLPLPVLNSPLHVVHAGLLPIVPLLRQDPHSTMNMRFVSPSSHQPFAHYHKGTVRWTRVWNWYQRRLERGIRLPHVAMLGDGERTRDAGLHEVYRQLPSAPESKWRGDARGLVELIQGMGFGAAAEWVGRMMGVKEGESEETGMVMRGGRKEAEGERRKRREEWERKRKGERPEAVVYGHNSKDGVRVERWTVGLDGGCVGGGRLVAMTLDAKGRRELVSVKCKNYLS